MSARVRIRKNRLKWQGVEIYFCFCYHLYIINVTARNKLSFDRCLKTSQNILLFSRRWK